MTDKVLIDRSVLEQALEALTNCASEYGHRCNRCDSEVDPEAKVASALRAALDQPQVEQKPIAWANINKQGDITHTSNKKTAWAKTPLYTHPQPRQPLTEDGIKQAFLAAGLFEPGDELVGYEVEITRAIERAHGIGGEK